MSGTASYRLGIDFGTSSTVAVVGRPGRGSRPLLFDGSPLLPSAICVDPAGRLVVGRDAVHSGLANPAGFEAHPKRCIDHGTVLLAGQQFLVAELIRAVLRRVLGEAAGVSLDPPDEIVLTCPASWGGPRRQTLLSAAPPGTRLLAEPVAAAHSFADIAGHSIPDGRIAAVYDFGAGTFDASVVRRTGDRFEVLAASGLHDAGGLDIDAAIVAHFRTALPDPERWRRIDAPVDVRDRRHRQGLWDNVRTGKEMLSRASSTLIYMPLFDIEVPLGREELDTLAAPILERTVTVTRGVLELAGAHGPLAAVWLAGGSSRMPAVSTALHRAFGLPPTTVDQPELAVAEGSLRADSSRSRAAVTALAPNTPAPAAPSPASVATVSHRPADRRADAATHTGGHRPGAASPTGRSPAAGPGPVRPATAPPHNPASHPTRSSGPPPSAAPNREPFAPIAADPSFGQAGPRSPLRGFRVLAIRLGVALAALILAVIVVSVVIYDGHPDRGAPVGSSSGASDPSGVDTCLVGTWRTHVSTFITTSYGPSLTFTGGAGAIITYKADGTVSEEDGSSQPFVATDGADRYEILVRGTFSGRWRLDHSQIIVSDAISRFTSTTSKNGVVLRSGSASADTEAETYTCSPTTMRWRKASGDAHGENDRVSGTPTV